MLIRFLHFQTWDFVSTLSDIIYPYITSATNPKGDGLCTFSSIAVSLGRDISEAVAVQSEMLAEVMSRYDWYEKHLKSLISSEFGIQKMLKILKNPKNTAPHSLYYPVHGGSCIVANTYQRPVITYSDRISSSTTWYPFFSPPQDVDPIIIGMINDCHCISLTLDINSQLPIPCVRNEWYNLREDVAKPWEKTFFSNQEKFRLWRRSANKKGKNVQSKTATADIELD